MAVAIAPPNDPTTTVVSLLNELGGSPNVAISNCVNRHLAYMNTGVLVGGHYRPGLIAGGEAMRLLFAHQTAA